ncbi:hypothetical protein [Klebsiella oxytoca]|uniref:hypothetical protein n=1 Tax=Klebsiella oxytoca TaxID=571 RepID=UPI0034D2F36B
MSRNEHAGPRINRVRCFINYPEMADVGKYQHRFAKGKPQYWKQRVLVVFCLKNNLIRACCWGEMNPFLDMEALSVAPQARVWKRYRKV